MRREVQRFKAVSDDGRNVEIIEYATVRREFNMHDGPYDAENKLRTLVTEDGDDVTPTDVKGEYIIVWSGLRVRDTSQCESR